MKKLLFALCILLPVRGEAAAFTVADIGDTLTVIFNGNVGGVDIPGLTGEVDFTLTSFDAGNNNSAVFDVVVRNTSSAPISASRISAFGFNSNPDVIGGTSTSAEYTQVITGSQFPNNFGSIEVCVIDNPNTCTGGGGSGVLIGEVSPVFQLTLNFANLGSTLTLDNFGMRYQSITGAGLVGASGTGSGSDDENPPPPPPPPPVVPEPSTMLLLGSGLALGVRKLKARLQA